MVSGPQQGGVGPCERHYRSKPYSLQWGERKPMSHSQGIATKRRIQTTMLVSNALNFGG